MSDSSDEAVRVDIWLWRARFFKTRAQATDYVARKGMRITRHALTRKTNKAGQRVLPGDVLTFYKAKSLVTIEIVALGDRRGPAAEAQALYRQVSSGA